MRTGIFGILIFLLFAGNIYSFDQSKKDSLLARISVTHGEDRLHSIDRLLVYTIYNDLDTSYFYATTLLKEAKEQNNIKYESLAYSWLTVYSFFKGEYYKGENYIKKAIKIQEQINDTLDLGNSYINLVMIYAETGRYKEAIEAAFNALHLFRSIDHVHGIIVSYGNLGIMYNKLQDYENAVKYLKLTADIMFKNKEFSNLGELYNNMGISYYHLNNNDSAITYYHKAIDEYNRNKEFKGTARAYLNMANTYAYNLQNYDSAFHYYDMAMQTSKGVIDALKTKVNGNKGKVYLLKGDYYNAEKFLKLALDQARESNDLTEQLDNYHELYNLYKRRGKYPKAIEYLEKYNEINDSINVANARVTIANLEAKFENEKNLLKIKELNTRREADRKVKHLLLAGLVLLSFILLLTILFFVQKRKKAFLKRELLRSEKEKLEKEVQFKSRQLTSQALMMIQKNRMLNDILSSLKSIKHVSEDSKHVLTKLNQQIKHSIQSGEDWEMFRHYFEEINPDFYPRLLKINSRITPAEQKLSALIKLNFNIKETASLLNISPDSVKTTRHILRKKLGLDKNENIHEFLNSI